MPAVRPFRAPLRPYPYLRLLPCPRPRRPAGSARPRAGSAPSVANVCPGLLFCRPNFNGPNPHQRTRRSCASQRAHRRRKRRPTQTTSACRPTPQLRTSRWAPPMPTPCLRAGLPTWGGRASCGISRARPGGRHRWARKRRRSRRTWSARRDRCAAHRSALLLWGCPSIPLP